MKKKTVIVWSVITLLTIVATLEILDFHPSLHLSGFSVSWAGIRDMTFTTGLLVGNGGSIQVYGFGPIVIHIPT